ncbi:MAG: type II toxin-antitoxin system PemK/MazF family toxin [Pseudomonadota bacterium]|jgi:mRNA interferase MazF
MLCAFDVVVVPFPYSDRLSEKRRPALVVSHEDVVETLGRVWVAMITSASPSQIGDAVIADLPDAGLPVASILRASKIATIDADRVIRAVGRLSSRDAAVARIALQACAGF